MKNYCRKKKSQNAPHLMCCLPAAFLPAVVLHPSFSMQAKQHTSNTTVRLSVHLFIRPTIVVCLVLCVLEKDKERKRDGEIKRRNDEEEERWRKKH